MTTHYYCTPEWLKECFELYQENAAAKQKLKKLSANMAYRVKSEPAWGIDQDIYFCAYFNAGELERMELVTREAAENSQFLLTATPQTWKSVLTRNSKFITDFMLGKIKLEVGSKVGVLSVAPHANDILDTLTPEELVFPDELSPEDLEQYRTNMEMFRTELAV